MSRRRVQRVRYHLDARGIRSLPAAEIEAILRGADDLIFRGGRNLLAKILRGSRAREVLERSLDRSPVHGYYKDLKEVEVLARIDWVILNGYLAIEYDYRLPILVYTPRGWEIERETYAEELLRRMTESLSPEQQPFDVGSLKDRNREMIWRLLDRIEGSRDSRLLPLLEAWAKIDYRKVRERIADVMKRLPPSGTEEHGEALGDSDEA
jgi:hypothetical protein